MHVSMSLMCMGAEAGFVVTTLLWRFAATRDHAGFRAQVDCSHMRVPLPISG